MKPYLKWVGSKSNLIEQLSPYFPESIEGTFYDPFMGSGAILFWLKERQPNLNAVCSDANPDLINCHKQVRDHLKQLIQMLDTLQNTYNKLIRFDDKSKMYYGIRDSFNSHTFTKLQQAAFFIFLNKLCFNGLWRVNQLNGAFNVPFARYLKTKLYDSEAITACSNALKNVKLTSLPYQKSLTKYPFTEKDIIYIDPPFVAAYQKTTHRAYTQIPFSTNDDAQLEKGLSKIHQRYGTKIIASNSIDAQTIYESWAIHKIARQGTFNSNGEGRQPVSEIVAVLA